MVWSVSRSNSEGPTRVHGHSSAWRVRIPGRWAEVDRRIRLVDAPHDEPWTDSVVAHLGRGYFLTQQSNVRRRVPVNFAIHHVLEAVK